MVVYCPIREGASINCLICIYSCEAKVKEICKEYEANYDAISKVLVQSSYVSKYGPPGFILPKSRRPKPEKKRGKKKIEAAKVGDTDKPVAVPAKPKRKRRTKAEMEAARKSE